VQLDKLPDQGQADAEAALSPFRRTLPLEEEIKGMREDVGSHACPRVLDLEYAVAALRLHPDPNAPSWRRVPSGVLHEVRQDLVDSH
jgi:hypothetical protein